MTIFSKHTICTGLFLCWLGLVPAQVLANSAVGIDLPAATIRKTLNDLAPIPLQSGKHIDGIITVDSIDKLEMKGDVISLHGVLSGRNLGVNTTVAGQNIRLKIGEVRLPLTCDLSLRFDQKQKKLFLKPHFTEQGTPQSGDPAAAVLPLLTALGDREYPVDLTRLQPVTVPVGGKSVPIRLEPVGVKADGNRLSLAMQPVVDKAKAVAAPPAQTK